jgi:hypothetical protein
VKVFVSYSRAESNSKLVAEQLAKALNDSAMGIWDAPFTHPGASLEEAVRQAVRDADAIVVVS